MQPQGNELGCEPRDAEGRDFVDPAGRALRNARSRGIDHGGELIRTKVAELGSRGGLHRGFEIGGLELREQIIDFSEHVSRLLRYSELAAQLAESFTLPRGQPAEHPRTEIEARGARPSHELGLLGGCNPNLDLRSFAGAAHESEFETRILLCQYNRIDIMPTRAWRASLSSRALDRTWSIVLP